jgi:hypothetical protein
MIYIFRQYDSNKQINIYAESYLEAKEVLYEFNAWADKIYNIVEYKMYDIDIDKFWEVLNIDKESYGYPRIISSKEMKLLKDNKVFKNLQFANHNNVRVLTTGDSSEGFKLLSTEEFVNKLKDNANNIEKHKNNIYKMLDTVGDIWFEEFYLKNSPHAYIAYGKSRYQCRKIIKEIKEKYNDRVFNIYNIQTLLIENDYGDQLTDLSIRRYNKMVEFMKKYNILKFPFTTFTEEDS